MSDQKKFIYYPSFSSKTALLKKDNFNIGELKTIRFYTDDYPERFRHKYFLLTAANFLNARKNVLDVVNLRGAQLFGDSGGFQIATGALKWEPTLLENIFRWLEEHSHIAMNLDIPPRLKYKGKFKECLDITVENIKYFHKHQSGKTKYLNIVQCDKTEQGYGVWYEAVKHYDFNGWSVGSTGLQYYNAIYATALLLQNREFEKINCETLHFLGTTSPFNFMVYASIQKNLNRYYPHCQVSTDSATPLKQGVYGNWYHSINYKKLNWNQLYFGNKGRTNYIMDEKLPCVLGCPICSNIKFEKVANYQFFHQFQIYVAWHNLAIFKNAINEVSDLVYSHKRKGVLSIMFPADVLKMMESIDEMFEKPEDALVIYNKYKKIYEKLANSWGNIHDSDLANSSLFKSDDEVVDDAEEKERAKEIAEINSYDVD